MRRQFFTATSIESIPKSTASRIHPFGFSRGLSLLLITCVLFFAPQQRSYSQDSTATEDTPGVTIPDAALKSALLSAVKERLTELRKHPANQGLKDEDFYRGSEILPVGMLSLKVLKASSLGIRDLTGLEKAYYLQELDLDGNQISDISALSRLTKLSKLDIALNDISDLTPLKLLTNLDELILGGNNIVDISPLAALTNLKILTLSRNNIVDISPLTSLAQMEHLEVYRNQIIDPSPLIPLAEGNLDFLRIDHNSIPAAAVATLRAARESWDLFEAGYQDAFASIPDDTLEAALVAAVRAAGGTVTEDGQITKADIMNRVTALDLSGKSVENLAGLAFARNLATLNLNNTGMTQRQFSELAEIAKSLPKLTELDLGYNNITDPTPLASLTQLTKLHLHHNNIVNVSSLAGLTHLTELQLNGNKIANVAALGSLTQLTTLNLNRNRLVDITPLGTLTNLTHLYLGRNRISDVAPLASLSNLQELTIGHNAIQDFTPIAGVVANLTAYRNVKQKQPAAVEIPDTALKGAILTALGKTGDATLLQTDMAELTSLTATGLGITDLTGLKFATNLRTLVLQNNKITGEDLKPLKDLTQLTRLNLANNRIKVVRHLAGLTNLTSLNLAGNPVKSLGPIERLQARNPALSLNRAEGPGTLGPGGNLPGPGGNPPGGNSPPPFGSSQSGSTAERRNSEVSLDADVNRDGTVDSTDRDIVSRLLGTEDLTELAREENVYPDVDLDGDVDADDVAAVEAAVSGRDERESGESDKSPDSPDQGSTEQ